MVLFAEAAALQAGVPERDAARIAALSKKRFKGTEAADTEALVAAGWARTGCEPSLLGVDVL